MEKTDTRPSGAGRGINFLRSRLHSFQNTNWPSRYCTNQLQEWQLQRQDSVRQRQNYSRRLPECTLTVAWMASTMTWMHSDSHLNGINNDPNTLWQSPEWHQQWPECTLTVTWMASTTTKMKIISSIKAIRGEIITIINKRTPFITQVLGNRFPVIFPQSSSDTKNIMYWFPTTGKHLAGLYCWYTGLF